jgi:hypothetical protein
MGIGVLGALLTDQDGLCQDEASTTFALLVVQLEEQFKMPSTDVISNEYVL